MESMWIYLTLSAAFCNGLWTAISKNSLQRITAFDFTLIFRTMTTFMLLPWFLCNFEIPKSEVFWWCTLCAGFLEVLRITLLSQGIKKDYYSTYAIYNTSPVLTIIIAPIVLPEKINLALIIGALATVSGAFIFYRIGKFSYHGLMCALTSCLTGILSKIAIGYSSPFPFMFFSFSIGITLMCTYGIVFKSFSGTRHPRESILKISGIAFISMLATVCYYYSIGLAPITRVNPLVRMNLLFGFIFSYFLLKEKEDWFRKMCAGACIVFGAIFISIS